MHHSRPSVRHVQNECGTLHRDAVRARCLLLQVLSLFRRQSSSILSDLPRYNHWYHLKKSNINVCTCKYNTTLLTINTNCFFSFKGARGFGSELIIVDEGNFIKADVYRQSILPVAQGKNIVLIILSTPLGQDNETTRLFNTKDDDGKPIIRAVRIGRSCEECRIARTLCTHVENATGEGLSRRKRKAFMNFYAEQMHVAMREYTGETSDDSVEIYKKEWIQRLLRRKPFETPALVDMLFVSIDPAQGGSCEWGFCACYYDVLTNLQVIVQLDGPQIDDVTPNLLMEWLRESINHLRRRSASFASIPIVIACEGAPIVISRQLQYYVALLIEERSIFNVHIMREMPGEAPGVPKTAVNTRHMVEFSAHLLQNDQVVFSDVFGSALSGVSHEIALREKTKFLQQLVNVKIRMTPSQRQDGLPKARIDGKSGGMNDDVAVAWIMNYYWYLQFMKSMRTDYQQIKSQSFTKHRGYVTLLSHYQATRLKRIRDHACDLEPIYRSDSIESNYYDFDQNSELAPAAARSLIDRRRSGVNNSDFLL